MADVKGLNKLRLRVQLAFSLLTNGYAAGFVKGKIYQGDLKVLCVPGLNCYSCPGALGACPIGSLQATLNSGDFKLPLYVTGFLFAFGALFGRFVCGWLCPFGLVQDLLYKIPFVKKAKNLPGDRMLRHLKYLILALFVILLPLLVRDAVGLADPWFCKYICPSGTLLGSWPLLSLNGSLRSAAGWLFAWKSLLLILIAALSVAVYRPFCKYLCPLGALYGFFNSSAFYRFRVDEARCVHCGICRKACPMGVQIPQKPNSPECIRCGICRKVCPQGAVITSFEKENGKGSENGIHD